MPKLQPHEPEWCLSYAHMDEPYQDPYCRNFASYGDLLDGFTEIASDYDLFYVSIVGDGGVLNAYTAFGNRLRLIANICSDRKIEEVVKFEAIKQVVEA